jgi:hypothetical protein
MRGANERQEKHNVVNRYHTGNGLKGGRQNEKGGIKQKDRKTIRSELKK